jgi:hypothetical protein
MSCERSRAPVFARSRCTCVLSVLTDTYSAAAISEFEPQTATSCRTSSSRLLNVANEEHAHLGGSMTRCTTRTPGIVVVQRHTRPGRAVCDVHAHPSRSRAPRRGAAVDGHPSAGQHSGTRRYPLEMGRLLLHHARELDGLHPPVADRTVVEDGRTAAIETSAPEPREGVEAVDVGGRTLMPACDLPLPCRLPRARVQAEHALRQRPSARVPCADGRPAPRAIRDRPTAAIRHLRTHPRRRVLPAVPEAQSHRTDAAAGTIPSTTPTSTPRRGGRHHHHAVATDIHKWSNAAGKAVVPSHWRATPGGPCVGHGRCHVAESCMDADEAAPDALDVGGGVPRPARAPSASTAARARWCSHSSRAATERA